MKELLDKIATYNLFNYLFPGVLYSVIINRFTGYSIPLDNLAIGAFICYFIGLIISRFGSLTIEPILKKIKFVIFSNYGDFVSASKKDPFIETLSEVNNMYRTLISMIVLLFLTKLFEIADKKLFLDPHIKLYLLLAVLLVVFLCSYKKQNNYIQKRINLNK